MVKQKMNKTRHCHSGKRFLSLFMALAMVLTTLVMPGNFWGGGKVYAATGIKLYFELPSGDAVTAWGVNAWGDGVTVTGDDTNKIQPGGWSSSHPALLTDGSKSGWGYVTVSGTIAGMQFVNSDGAAYGNCWNATIASGGYQEAYFSSSDQKWYTSAEKATEIKAPEVQNIFVLAGAAGLAGSSWNQLDMNNALKDAGSNKYSITYKGVLAGSYEYKILQDPENKGWDLPWGPNGDNRKVEVAAPSDVTFEIDLTDSNKDVKVTQKLVQMLVIENDDIVKGKAVKLNTSAKYYDGSSASASTATVSYALKGTPSGVTLSGDTITVAAGSELTEVTVTASYNGFSQDITIPVVDKQYKVTINMYSQDLVMQPGVSDVYIFENGGDRNTVVTLDKTVTDDVNGVTWVSGTATLPYNSLGIIARDKAGTWDGGQDSNKYYVIDKDNEEITLWYEYGKTPVTEKPVITRTAQRYLCLDYENPQLAAGITPQFYSWTTGYAAERVDFTPAGTGKWKINVPVKATCTKVDFVLVLDASGDDWVKDGGDHSVTFPLDQTVVSARLKTGEEPELSAPYNTGYELQPDENQILFCYRDDQALIGNTLPDLKVSVDVNGTEYPMTYNADNKRFEYAHKGLANGRTYYRYKLESGYVLDSYNSNQEKKDGTDYSYVDYYKLNASVSAEVMYPSFNYNENNVVKFTVNQSGQNEPKFKVKSASIDVSSLGGNSALAIEPELQAVTISATVDTPAGSKTLPIIVTDQYDNKYKTSVAVDVTARTKAGNDDFDWDEAVIYFMVTDRFFDGNPANNTANGVQTYGTNEGLYHGGDFAGITQKLDYLDELGINTIWITPVVENIPGVTVTGTGSGDVPYNAAYHGYWASDFTKLNPTLGTGEEFKNLIQEAHSRGIRIMVDIVVNHAGYDTEATFGDMLRKGDQIVSGDDKKDSLSGLPDFYTENSDVRAKLVEWQTQWIKDYDIDYYRVDTVKHVESTTWAALKNSLTGVNKDFKMIGEYAGGGYAGNGGTLGTGQMDSDLDFDFNDQASGFVKGNITSVENFMSARNAALNNTYLTGQFLGSHDEDGFKQKLISQGMPENEATAASLVAASLQITAKGQPVIYYGEETGLTGLNNYPYQTNRYDFDWSLTNDNNATYRHYKKLLAIRNDNTDVFARGDRKTVAASDADGYDVISRSYRGTTLYVGMNIKAEAKTVTIPVSEGSGAIMTDLYSGKEYTVKGGEISVTIPAAADGGTVILKRTGGFTNTPSGGSISSGGSGSSSGEPGDGNKPSDGTPAEKPGQSTTETKKDEITNSAGNKVNITTTTDKDAIGNVTGSKVVSVIAAAAKDTSVTVTVTKDASGKVTSATAAVATAGKKGKTNITGTIAGKVVSQIIEAAGTKEVDISVTVKAGKSSYTVSTAAGNLKANAKLKVMAVKKKTGAYVLVNAKTYKVSAAGSVSVALPAGKNYALVTEKEAAKVEKEILKTVKLEKSSVTVKKGKTSKTKLNSKLDMDNVSKVTYKSSKKSVATVNSKGKVTAKKAGTATITIKVTLKNGKTKNVKLKVKVK